MEFYLVMKDGKRYLITSEKLGEKGDPELLKKFQREFQGHINMEWIGFTNGLNVFRVV